MDAIRAAFLTALVGLLAPASVSGQEFRVATQNIWKGLTQYHNLATGSGGQCYQNTPSGPSCNSYCMFMNLVSIGSHLNTVLETRPALVGLQEVHQDVSLSCHTDQPDVLASVLGNDWTGIFGAVRSPYYTGAFGNGILHNQKTLFSGSVSFTNTSPEGQDRGLVVSLVEFASGRRLWFGSTHLDHKEPTVALLQAQEARQLMRMLAGFFGAPAVLVGDFNLGRAQTGCPGYAHCEAALLAAMTGDGAFIEVSADTAASGIRFSGHEAEERRKIDYIFLHDPDEQLEVVPHHVVHYRALGIPVATPVHSRSRLPCSGDWCAADHKTVVADLRFR